MQAASDLKRENLLWIDAVLYSSTDLNGYFNVVFFLRDSYEFVPFGVLITILLSMASSMNAMPFEFV